MAIKVLRTGSNRMQNNLSRVNTAYDSQSSKYTSQIEKYSKYSNILNIGSEIVGSATKAIAGFSGIGPVVSAFVSAFGLLGGAVASAANIIFQNKIADAQANQQKLNSYYSDIMQNLSYYGTSLENRDSALYEASSNIQSSINTLKTSYGEQFTSAIQNLFYQKSNMDSNTMSVINNNYKTYNEGYGGSGVAGWQEGTMFDTSDLTNDVTNYFNNEYSELETSDLNQSITDRLYQMLVTADTSFSMQVKGYEDELRTALSESLSSQRSTYNSFKEQFLELASGQSSTDLDSVLSIAKAQNATANSGIRGSIGNVAIQKLAKDMTDFENAYKQAYLQSQMQEAIYKAQVTDSATIATARYKEQYALKTATEQAINNWNKSVVSTAREAETTANEQIQEAIEYQTQAERDVQKWSELVG